MLWCPTVLCAISYTSENVMDKKCIPHSHATLCVLLCLATLLCFTSCFNLSSTQRGNFSFTINEAVAQQLENALGPRSARSAGAPVITATVTLTRTAGGEFTTPVAKSGTIASLINETFTFEDLPLHVPFTISVSFKADGKEIFSGTSEPITLTSEDTTPVAIALHHILDTDIVVPYWKHNSQFNTYSAYGSFQFSNSNDINQLPDLIAEDNLNNLSGGANFCFDCYGNIWSIDNSTLYWKGKDPIPMGSPEGYYDSGFTQSVILNSLDISCDYSTNDIYVTFANVKNGQTCSNETALVKFSVDEMLSLEKEMLIPSVFINDNSCDNYRTFGFTLTSTEPLISGESCLETLLGYDISDGQGLTQWSRIHSFTVNNGILYVGFLVDGNDADVKGIYVAAIDPVTKQKLYDKKIDIVSVFGSGLLANATWDDFTITDMLFLDGKLYALINYGNSLGALVRINPTTLSFSNSDVLGVSKDIKKELLAPGSSSDGYWKIRTPNGGGGTEPLYSQKNRSTNNQFFEKTVSYNIVSNDTNNFLGPIKFVAIKPKKLVVADCGFYYNDGDIDYYGNRLLTIDLTSFSITDETDVPFFMTDRPDAENLPVFESLPFTEGQELYYSTATNVWSTVKFSESLISSGSIFYYLED